MELTSSLGHLVRTVPWDGVRAALLRHYPEERKNIAAHECVFEQLRSARPAPTRFWLVIHPREPDPYFEPDPDEPQGEAPAHVSSADGTLCEHDGEEQRFGLDFIDWAECLGMEVLPVTRERYTDAEIVAHCLWEMTWYGFDESGKREVREELERRLNDPDREFVPVDEMLERLGLDEESSESSGGSKDPSRDGEEEDA